MAEAERLKVDEFETRQEGDTRVPDPKGIVTRWLAELALASRTESKWRDEVKNIWKRYKTDQERASFQDTDEATFNILWSNTEIIVPALYNSTPTPDVRRRFKDADPIGKVASTVLERGLSYSIDTYDFDGEITSAVLDFALAGRGITRIRYRPNVQSVDVEPNEAGEAQEPTERIVDQDTTCEHVQWDDFRRGPGKTWGVVPWVAFRHDMGWDDLVEYFGEEKAQTIKLTQLSEDDSDGMDSASGVKRLFQSGEVWEIWDKLKKRVLFIAQGTEEPLLVDDDPRLKLRGFFPMPKPAMAVLDSTSLVPIPLYRQYKAQAQEMDRLTRRIEKITAALRLRGVYHANVKEAAQLMDASDTEMIPIEDAAALSMIGLDKLIWIMPVEKLITVLEGLYKAREQIKQTIYEIIGLSDIMRGATKATETLGAQELKSKWGSVRLQRMQKEIQRFVRDILRLKGEVIAEHYEPDVLAEMTQIKLPRAQEKEQLQMGVQQMQAQGQEVPPEYRKMLETPTWEDVIAVLRSDAMRTFRISVETDSTIREMIQQDFAGLSEVLNTLSAVFGAAPQLQQAGASNGPEVTKEIALSVCRQAKMGRAVEDAVENLDFQAGGSQIDQLTQMVQQIGQAVQQGAEQLQQMGQSLEQGTQKLGQHEKILEQLIKIVQTLGPEPPQQQPAMAAVQ